MCEVFAEDEYATRLDQTPRSIVDIGGHAGYASVYFATVFPKAAIRVYEPDPGNFSVLQMNTRDISAITARQAAVSGTSGTATFYAGTSSISSSLLPRDDSRKIVVNAVTLDEILSEQPADLIKFDVEGAEYDLFAASHLRASCADYIGEMHYDLIGHTRREFLDIFAGFLVKERMLTESRSIVELNGTGNTPR
jgi:FkbM family methyltransferase